MGAVEVVSVRKLNCVEAKERAGFNCDVEVTVNETLKGEHKETQNRRFIQVDGAWRLAS